MAIPHRRSQNNQADHNSIHKTKEQTALCGTAWASVQITTSDHNSLKSHIFHGLYVAWIIIYLGRLSIMSISGMLIMFLFV